MLGIGTALIVDDSRVLLSLAEAILAPHAKRVVTAESLDAARTALEQLDDVSLLLLDVILPDGSGFELLDEVARSDALAKPAVIMMTIRPCEDDAAKAAALGAVGYLSKPLRFADIEQCLADQSGAKRSRAPRIRTLPIGRAIVVDVESDAALLVCEIHDLSSSGAFLLIPGRLALGTRLNVILELPNGTARVEAEVVRVQEPTWGHGGGAGIAFRSFAPEAKGLIDDFINRG